MAGMTNTKAKYSVHTCEPSFGGQRWEDLKFDASLGYVCRVLVSKKKICNLSFCKCYTTELQIHTHKPTVLKGQITQISLLPWALLRTESETGPWQSELPV